MTTEGYLTRVRIDPLTGVEDWPSWRVQMEDLLYEAKLWTYVTGTNRKPVAAGDTPTATEQASIDEWMAKDRSALSAIRMRVSKALVSTLKRCVTSAEAWKRLEKNFEPKGILRVVQLR